MLLARRGRNFHGLYLFACRCHERVKSNQAATTLAEQEASYCALAHIRVGASVPPALASMVNPASQSQPSWNQDL